jgi:Tol biopolymer transport system component
MGEGGDIRFAPDGAYIYFTRQNIATLEMQLYRMNPDGSAQTPLGLMQYDEDQASLDSDLAVSGDGRLGAWAGYFDDNYELFTGVLDTGVRTRVTTDADAEFAPAWSPCPD